MESSIPSDDATTLLSKLEIHHEDYRNKAWYGNKCERTPKDNEYYLSESIKSEEEIINSKKQFDKEIINKVRQAAIDNEIGRAISLAE